MEVLHAVRRIAAAAAAGLESNMVMLFLYYVGEGDDGEECKKAKDLLSCQLLLKHSLEVNLALDSLSVVNICVRTSN
jgi:hypothetical protein